MWSVSRLKNTGWGVRTYHARLHSANSFILRIVGNVRCTVEEIVYAVSAVGANDGAACCTCDRLTTLRTQQQECDALVSLSSLKTSYYDVHHLANITEESTWFAYFDSCVETLAASPHESD